MTTGDARPDRGSWLVVWRALRVGHVDDPRYEALTRETAERNVRNSWMLVFFAAILAVQVVLVVLRLARGVDPTGTVATAVSAALIATSLGLIWVARRRSKRYLDACQRREGRQ